MRATFFVAAAFAVQPMLASAKDEPQEPLVLQPSSPWHIKYADDSCRLVRTFGEAHTKSALYIERYEPGDEFYLVVAGKPLEARENITSRFEFGPGGMVRDDERQWGKLAEFGAAAMVSDMQLAETQESRDAQRERRRYDREREALDTDLFGQLLTPEQEAGIEWLEVRRGENRPVHFALGSMGLPMAKMRRCTDDLLTQWGINLQAHRGLTRAAAPKYNPGKWISPRDYPRDLMLKGAQGMVQFRLSVGPDGKPTQCHIQQSTRPGGFDRAVCDVLMRRARFEPALGADGQPIASFWRSAVRFEMPG